MGTGLDGDDVVDLTGRTVLPGLFDCHVHFADQPRRRVDYVQLAVLAAVLRGDREHRATLDSGITTVRDAGGADLGDSRRWPMVSSAVRACRSRITMLSQTGGHGDDWHLRAHEPGFA